LGGYSQWGVSDDCIGHVVPYGETSCDWDGMLGLSDLSPFPTALGGGFGTLCAFDPATSGSLKCWGSVQGEPQNVKAQSVKCSVNHCCALDDGHSLECWGTVGDYTIYTDTNQFDDVSIQDFAVGLDTTCVLSTDRKVKCVGDGETSFNIPAEFDQTAVAFSSSFGGIDVASGGNGEVGHFCIFEETNDLAFHCWGPNDFGQLGQPRYLVVKGLEGSPHLSNSDYKYCGDSTEYQTPNGYSSEDERLPNANMIAIRCCDGNGNAWSPMTSSAYEVTPDCYQDAYLYKNGATFEEAKAVCADRGDGYRLCTLEEAQAEITRNTGCYYNHAYHWVSDACAVDADAYDNAMVNERAETGSMTAEEVASNDNDVGNGSINVSTITIIIGAAGGAALIVAVTIMILLKSRKADVHFEADGAERAADVSSSDIAVKIGMDKVTADNVDIGDEQVAAMEMPRMSAPAIGTEGNGAAEMAQ